jgi:hypothetical protein
VQYETLQELLSYCRQALETKDADILVPVEGFFFGSTAIDEHSGTTLNKLLSVLKGH